MKCPVVLAPVGLHADVQVEEDFGREEPLQFLAVLRLVGVGAERNALGALAFPAQALGELVSKNTK